MIEELLRDFETLRERIRLAKTHRSILQSQASKLEAEESEARRKADVYQRCSEICKKWLEDSLEKNVTSMADLATMGLRHTIKDQNLTFRVVQEAKYNRMAMRFILEEKSEDGSVVEGDPLNSYGGGAAAIISLVLRLAVMSRMKMGNLLLLDESMVWVSAAYVPNTAAFMRHLAERTGVNILMVTHNPEFIAHAHTAYEGHKDGCLKLRKLRTADPT
jgi:DNA repair exonuclease SbcCD ATPase subunit